MVNRMFVLDCYLYFLFMVLQLFVYRNRRSCCNKETLFAYFPVIRTNKAKTNLESIEIKLFFELDIRS